MTATTRDPSAVPWDSPTVRVVFAATALASLGVPLVSSALPVFKSTFALGEFDRLQTVSGFTRRPTHSRLPTSRTTATGSNHWKAVSNALDA